MKKLATILICLSFISVSSCTWWDAKEFFANHQKPAENVRLQWGEPLSVEVLEKGVQKWVYFIDDQWFACEYYFLIKEGVVVDSGPN